MRVRSFAAFGLLGLGCCVGLACFEAKPPPLSEEDFGWSREDLSAASIVDEGRAFLVSTAGSIYRSEDAGETWRRVHSDPGTPLFDIEFETRDRGWALGSSAVWSTLDSGDSWQRHPLPADPSLGRLRALAVPAPNHLVVVGLAGARLTSTDGGQTFRDRGGALLAVSSGGGLAIGDPRADLVALSCRRDEAGARVEADSGNSRGAPDCLAGGGPGGFSLSRDRGVTWEAIELAPLDPVETFEIGEGEVEWSSQVRARLVERASRDRDRSAVAYRIDARIHRNEMERFVRQGDPEALFDVIAARMLDAREILEEAGISSDRIELSGMPPWGYADYLDDDPDFLARYWRARISDFAGMTLSGVDRAGIRFVDLENRVASRSDRGFVRPEAEGARWRLETGSFEQREILSWARGHDGWWVVDGAGRLLRTSGAPWLEESDSAEIGLDHPGGARSVFFSEAGTWGLLLGKSGFLMRWKSDLAHWEAVPSSHSAP